jgi:gluconolactonase
MSSAKLGALVDGNVGAELLGSGFQFTEGPVWNPDGRFLVFSDVPASTRWRWDAAHGITQVAASTGTGNGMTLDADGRLIVCEHLTHAVVRMDAEGTGANRHVLASRFRGKTLNAPNDVVVHSDGSIYFTDPMAGRSSQRLPEAAGLGFSGVYRIRSDDSELELVADDFDLPNGLCFSPDESLLYANDTSRCHIRALQLADHGGTEGEHVLVENVGTFDPVRSPAEGGVVDGMKCDEHGNVWVTGPGGLWVLSPDGEHLGVVKTPEPATNLHWGGPDWSWLFVTARTKVFRVQTRVSGRLEPFMRRGD